MDTLNSSLTKPTSSSSINVNSTSPYTTVEMVIIILVTGTLSLITIVGNILVMLSIKVNKNLQTINNYFLFSLACADFIIGICSMNLYTVYIVIGHWPLGAVVCDLWLALDYVVSNASVMNLLLISLDRYFCVTRPLSYPARRSTKIAGLMIAAAWVLSLIVWAPAILFWQFIVGGRTVPPSECYIQFFSNPVVTFGTAILAFYLPVAIMIYLYWRISKASRRRMGRYPRRTSGPSHAEAPSNSQEDGVESNSDPSNQSQEAPRDGRREKMFQERNGSGPRKEEQMDKQETASDIVHISTSKDLVSSVEQNQRRPFTLQTTSVDRQGFVARTLLKVASFPVSESIVAKWRMKGTCSRERKVIRTITALLVAFIVTWTPYNVMVLINTFCSICIPNTLWTFGYWLCYINSTINPVCYALCNVAFKNTFKHLLLCKCRNIRSR